MVSSIRHVRRTYVTTLYEQGRFDNNVFFFGTFDTRWYRSMHKACIPRYNQQYICNSTSLNTKQEGRFLPTGDSKVYPASAVAYRSHEHMGKRLARIHSNRRGKRIVG